jgi:large repetitive protein
MARTSSRFAWVLVGVSMFLAAAQEVHAKQATVTTITTSANPSDIGRSVTITATVTSQQSGQSNQHCPDGHVTFQINGVNVGAPVQVTPLSLCAVDGIARSFASIKFPFPSGGTYPVVAIYGGDHDFASSTSAPFTQTVGQGSPILTRTTVFSSGNPSVVGDAVTFTAVVAPVEWGFGLPAGTVTFTSGDTTLFIGTLNASGWLEFTTSSLPQGANTITATYAGTGIFVGSSGSLVQNVTDRSKTATTLQLAASPTAVIVGEKVWLTATVTPADYVAGIPTGEVLFSSGNVTITGTLNEDGWVTVSTSDLGLGANSITASYAGDANYSGSSATATELVSSATAIPTAIELVALPVTTIVGQAVSITATVTPAAWDFGDPTGTVTIMLTDARGNKSTLFNGALPPSGWVSFTTVSLPLGSNAISATYSGDVHYRASLSAVKRAQVGPLAGQIATSMVLVASPSVSVAGEPVWLTATVTPSDWTFGNPTGTVTFTSGNVTVTGTLATGGSADWVTVVTSALPQGSNLITATYSGDANYAGTTATAIETVTSLGIETQITLVASPNPSVFGEPVTITATVTPGIWGYGTPPGTVTLTGGGITLTETLSNGWTVFMTSALPQGASTLTATYGGNSVFKGTSATTSQTVNARP